MGDSDRLISLEDYASALEYDLSMVPVDMEEVAEIREALELIVRQFDGIANDGWPTEGMKVAIEQARVILERC